MKREKSQRKVADLKKKCEIEYYPASRKYFPKFNGHYLNKKLDQEYYELEDCLAYADSSNSEKSVKECLKCICNKSIKSM